MVRRLIGSVCKDRNETQRENIFHTRCMAMGKICSLIIDGGRCTNVELVVDKQVLICFSIGKYDDEILFDVVPIEASHLLLQRPWQYDRDVVHNGVTNKFSFVHKGQKVTLTPLSPSEICEDQIKMRVKREQEKKKREKKN